MLHLLQYADPTSLTWVFGVSTVLAVAMGFATGANDVANTFGTSVGSGALTLKKALIAAGIFEMLGALALGSHVAGTLKAGIADFNCFEADPSLYMMGMMAALGSAALWLIFASLAGLPVSTTHSIVGGIVGMGMVLKGPQCINWGMTGVGKILVSWVTSPLLAGTVAFVFYTILAKFVIHTEEPFKRALWSTPFLLAGTVFFVEMLTFWDLVKPWWARVLLFGGSPLLVFLLASFFGVPWLRGMIQRYSFGYEAELQLSTYEDENAAQQQEDPNASDSLHGTGPTSVGINGKHREKRISEALNGGEDENSIELDSLESSSSTKRLDTQQTQLDLDADESSSTVSMDITDQKQSRQVFWYLQNVSACLGAFAHGANDTANAIGPFSAIYYLWKDGTFDAAHPVPLWIVALGGASIVLGLGILGYRVIKTMGTELIHVDYPKGFSSELSSSFTVVMASRLQIPVSSTHCQVGALIGVGIVRDPQAKSTGTANSEGQPDSNVDEESRAPHFEEVVGKNDWRADLKARLAQVHWKSVGKIFISWLVTVPVSAGVSAFIAFILKKATAT